MRFRRENQAFGFLPDSNVFKCLTELFIKQAVAQSEDASA